MVEHHVPPSRPSVQYGPFAYRKARSVSGNRKEDLLGATIGHWCVIESLTDGYWLCSCVSCNQLREVRLNKTQTGCPPCLHCERGRTTIEQMLMDRERHLATRRGPSRV